MTNREWLESLTDEEFVAWLVFDEYINNNTMEPIPPTPKLYTLKYASTNTPEYLRKWLKEERGKR